MKHAVVISFNWKTEETLHTAFEGGGCADKAAGWAHKTSFLWKDFPAEEMCSTGTFSEQIPR